MTDRLAISPTLDERERAHCEAVERAWETGRAELALLRGRPKCAEREALLRRWLLATEEYMAARWVPPVRPVTA